jgi:phosphoribosylamine-glycine ligase
MKFIFFSEFGETLDLAAYMTNVCKAEVVFYIHDVHSRNVGKGIVHQVENWFQFLGQDFTWIFDSCAFGALQDWLRSKDEAVFGGCEAGDHLENDRQANQAWFREAGFHQPTSKNFTAIDAALKFVQDHADKRWVLKQNGEAPKSINHIGKFANNEDMIHHLTEMQRSWNESQFGPFNCDLMEFVSGMEVAASVFFNGNDYIRNSKGRVIGFLNFEEKKESDGGLGETCGEMGTTFLPVDERHPLFRRIVMREELTNKLKEIGFHGVFDINCIVRDDGKIVALEPTMRFGIPATSYEFIEGLESSPCKLIDAVARGNNPAVEVKDHNVGMVMCVVAKPFPIEADVETQSTSLGEVLWILGKDEEPQAEFSDEQRTRIHLYNFEKSEDGKYKVATKNGYLLTITGHGDSIAATRKALIKYIRHNIYISGMKFRSDIGERVEEFESDLIGD